MLHEIHYAIVANSRWLRAFDLRRGNLCIGGIWEPGGTKSIVHIAISVDGICHANIGKFLSYWDLYIENLFSIRFSFCWFDISFSPSFLLYVLWQYL